MPKENSESLLSVSLPTDLLKEFRDWEGRRHLSTADNIKRLLRFALDNFGKDMVDESDFYTTSYFRGWEYSIAEFGCPCCECIRVHFNKEKNLILLEKNRDYGGGEEPRNPFPKEAFITKETYDAFISSEAFKKAVDDDNPKDGIEWGLMQPKTYSLFLQTFTFEEPKLTYLPNGSDELEP